MELFRRGVRSALLCLLLLPAHAPAAPLVQARIDGMFLYYSKGRADLAARLADDLPRMLAHLAGNGLPVDPPVHIVLDDRRDAPEVKVHIIPHKEIRIPVRAPGVLEDGYTESDPWGYFLFRGLCLQGIFGIRSGIPGALHKGFGEIISPNAILPPWVEDGICSLQYSLYAGTPIQGPYETAIYATSPTPDVDLVSHRPQVWPGYYAYRIYGRPFIRWLFDNYGWEKIHEFLEVHGGGVVPFEIDLKAEEVFGRSGGELWSDFQASRTQPEVKSGGRLISGYWAEPFVYWNNAGVFPGKVQVRKRGRYGYVDAEGTVWISELDNTYRLREYAPDGTLTADLPSVWDPGPGRVAVIRNDRGLFVAIFPYDGIDSFGLADEANRDKTRLIPAPPGVIQMSGPVRSAQGKIAVAANRDGNWDIWVFDGIWRRATYLPSLEMDPWWERETLVWASNVSGRFQIHQADGTPLTAAPHGAILPRNGRYMNLTPGGWTLRDYDGRGQTFSELRYVDGVADERDYVASSLDPEPYDPFTSLWPNYIRPDIFAAVTDLQLGIATEGRDVTNRYRFDGAIRYSFDTDYLAARLGFEVDSLGALYRRYPVSYTTAVGDETDEGRNEISLYWRVLEKRTVKDADLLESTEGFGAMDGVELSVNWRTFDPLENTGTSGDEGWLAVGFAKSFGILRAWGNAEAYTQNRQSLFGGIRIIGGDEILTSLHLVAGKSWGERVNGHTTFRIGGSLTEGYFTQRPSRLFPIRGFDSNLLESQTAAAGGLEIFWPLANLQKGYKTLPVFLHRLRLGTFIDAGFASERLAADDMLVGAGFELVTSLEMAWETFSALRIGVAWPVAQPTFLNQSGPVFVFQLGKPL